MFDPGIGQCYGAGRGWLGLLRTKAPRGYRGLCRDFAERPLYHRADIHGVDVAGNHQRRVIRRIETPVERQRIFAVELLDLLTPANDGAPIGMIEV